MAQNAAQHSIQQQHAIQHAALEQERREQQNAIQNGRRQNTWPLTTGLYLFNNVLHLLYYDERNIIDRPVGISVMIDPFEEPFVYFLDNYEHNHTRAINNFVYYGRNHDEVNHMRTFIMNRTNEARNLLNSIINSYIE